MANPAEYVTPRKNADIEILINTSQRDNYGVRAIEMLLVDLTKC